jgi:hypothetical protein
VLLLVLIHISQTCSAIEITVIVSIQIILWLVVMWNVGVHVNIIWQCVDIVISATTATSTSTVFHDAVVTRGRIAIGGIDVITANDQVKY